jgi:MFS family permease
MLPVDLFRIPIFSLSVATSISCFIAQGIAFIALPFLFEAGSGASQIETGLLMTPWPATVIVAAPLAGRLSDKIPAGILGGIGLASLSAGLLLVLALPPHAPFWDFAWRMSLCGAGFGFFQAPNNRLIIGSAPRERSGAGSGMLSTARLVGQTTGAALVAVSFSLTANAGGTVGGGQHDAAGACGAAGRLTPPHVPEQRQAVQDAGEVGTIGGRRQGLAERDVRHVLECLELHPLADFLLGVDVRRGEPRGAQFFQLRTVRPPGRRVAAVGAEEHVAGWVELIEPGP